MNCRMRRGRDYSGKFARLVKEIFRLQRRARAVVRTKFGETQEFKSSR